MNSKQNNSCLTILWLCINESDRGGERKTYFDMCQLYIILHFPGSNLFSALKIRSNPYSNRLSSPFCGTYTNQFNDIEIETLSLNQFKAQILKAITEKRAGFRMLVSSFHHFVVKCLFIY